MRSLMKLNFGLSYTFSFSVILFVLMGFSADIAFSQSPTKLGEREVCNYSAPENTGEQVVHSTSRPGSVVEEQITSNRKLKEQERTLEAAMHGQRVKLDSVEKVESVLNGAGPHNDKQTSEQGGPSTNHLASTKKARGRAVMPVGSIIDTGNTGWIEDNSTLGWNGEEKDEIGPEQLKELLKKALEGYDDHVSGWVHRAFGNNNTINGAKWMGSKTIDLMGVLFAGAKAAAASGPIVKKMLKKAGVPTSKKDLFKKGAKKGKKKLKKGVRKKLKKLLKDSDRFIARKFKVGKGQSGAKGTIVVVYDKKSGTFVARARKKSDLSGTSWDRGARPSTMEKGGGERTYKGKYGKKDE